MLTYTESEEKDSYGFKYTNYRIFSDSANIMFTCDKQVVDYLISQGMMKKEA